MKGERPIYGRRLGDHRDEALQSLRQQSPAPASRRRRLIWPRKILFACVPTILLLALIEAALWLGSYESPVADPYDSFVLKRPLFVATEGDTLTTAFPRRKFFHVQSFTRTKTEHCKRIFVFGGSTTYGYKLDDPQRDGYVTRLGEVLQDRYPHTAFEMINCGGISYASYRLVDLVEECLQYSPDLIIVMSGHNEFLEARYYADLKGLDSAAYRAWFSLRTVRLLAHLSNQLNTKVYDSRQEAEALLRDNPHVGERYIVRDAAEFQHTLDHYTRNLNRMVDACQAVDTPIVLSTCPANLLDHPPFESEPPAGMTRGEYYNLTERAFRLWQRGHRKESLAICQSILEKGPRSAAAHYIAGKCYYDGGRWDDAKQSFIAAKDTDSFPKRALTRFNQRVREIAQQQAIRLFDGEQLFFQAAEHGIPGEPLFLDDCHPTPQGHRLFAAALAEIAAEVFNKRDAAQSSRPAPRAVRSLGKWVARPDRASKRRPPPLRYFQDPAASSPLLLSVEQHGPSRPVSSRRTGRLAPRRYLSVAADRPL